MNDQIDRPPREWFLSGEELGATRDKIARLNRRAARRGFTGRIAVHAKPVTRSHVPAPGAPPLVEHGFTVTIGGEPPQYGGWHFVAAADVLRPATPIAPSADGPPTALQTATGEPAHVVLRYAPGADPIENGLVRPGECDHCQTLRPCATTFIVRHEHTGELKQVGRSCLKDFLGHSTAPVFLDTTQIADEIDGGLHGSSRVAAWGLHSVLTYAWAVVETHGWAPRSNAYPTRDLVDQALGGGRRSAEVLASITGKLQQGSEMAPQIVTDLINGLHGDSGYEASLLSIVHAGVVDRRKHLGLAVSAIPAWRRLPQANPDPAEPQPARTISYAGQIGAKITLAGTITTAIWIDGYHHNSPPQRLIILDCGDAVAKMITAAAWADDIQRGDHLTVTATVKDHRDYRGTQQTLLVRPRRIDLPDTSTAASGSPSTPAWEPIRAVPPQSRFPAAPLAPGAPPPPGLAV